MIYISSGAHHEQPAWKTSEQYAEMGINFVELSGGLHDADQLIRLKGLKQLMQFQIHNYFPPPKEPFVFNLASLNQNVSDRSYRHAVDAIQWALELDRPVYSFHAGFLLDPHVNDLGSRLSSRALLDRDQALARFIEQVNQLAEHSRILGVKLLIENNALSASNYHEFSADPFLMTTAEECKFVMQNTPHNVNLLVDVAHLKVSAQSLQFDRRTFLDVCGPWIQAYHLSDNDGICDSHEPVTSDSWFWPHLKAGLDYYSLEISNVSLDLLVQQRELTQQKLSQI